MAKEKPRKSKKSGEETLDETPARRERFVVLFRHGIAEPKDTGKPDEERSLTREGHARLKETVRGLAEVFPKAEAIYSSPLLRCVQTALWISKAYKGKLGPKTNDVLAPAGKAKAVREFLDSLDERRVILVGHEPNLTEDLCELLRISDSGELELKKGGCYGVRLLDDGTAVLEWTLGPRLLRRLGD